MAWRVRLASGTGSAGTATTPGSASRDRASRRRGTGARTSSRSASRTPSWAARRGSQRRGERGGWRRARTAAMCDDAAAKELREEHERMSDVKLLAVLVSDEYRHEVRQLARSVIAARLGVPAADAVAILVNGRRRG